MCKAVAYIRVSTEEQVKHGQGLDIQEKEINNFCKSTKTELLNTFIDKGISGANDVSKRKGLNDLLLYCKDNEVHQVIVTKMDRLARDVYIQLWIEKELKIHDIQIISISEDNLNGDDYMTNAMRQMVAVFAELEKNRIADRLVSGRRNKAENGQKASGNCPFGYKYQYDSNGKNPIVVVDDVQAAIVKNMFSMYLQGNSLQAIATRLNDDGTLNARGNQWSKQAVKVILSNQFYTGVVKFNDIKLAGQHESIISKITFKKVQAALNQNAKKRG